MAPRLCRSVCRHRGQILGFVSPGAGGRSCPVLCAPLTHPASVLSWPTGPGSSERKPFFLRGGSPQIGLAFPKWPIHLLARRQDHKILGVGVGASVRHIPSLCFRITRTREGGLTLRLTVITKETED